MEVHRCRFIHWQPNEIQQLAINPSGSLLAVARTTGEMELWEVTPHGIEFLKVRGPLWTGRSCVDCMGPGARS
jgi:hypothetical protein